MAQDADVKVSAGIWKQLTNADVTSISFQCQSYQGVTIRVTVGAVQPTDTGGWYYGGVLKQGELNIALSDLSPGVVGGNRVYAFSDLDCVIRVSHA